MKNILLIILFLWSSFLAIGQTNIQWTKMVNVEMNGTTLTKTGGNGWNAGASSSQQLAANAAGYAEMTIAQENTHRFFGFSATDAGVHFTDIDFALFLLSNQSIRIYELGSYKGSYGTYTKGDQLRIERMGNQIKYSKNGVVLYTSTRSSTSSLVVDATIYHQGGTVENAVVSFGGSTNCTDADNDGVCVAEDCDDNNAQIPGTPGTSCNDNNSTTENDLLLADGCTCLGTPINGGGDTNSGLWSAIGNKIYHTGKVLIGPSNTTVPGAYNLYVTKGILSERVRVTPTTGNWADYVFEEDYPLNSLPSVEQHIRTKKHLPNVPSAAVVEKEGIDLGTMDATLLRQIEELWLHTIQLHKKIELLEEEIKFFKNQKE